MLRQLRLDDAAPWKQRFRAPKIFWTHLATANPTRGLAISNRESSAFQLYAWDVPGGELRQLTDEPGGILQGLISPDGRHVYYLQDRQGNELGHIVRLPFEGGESGDVTPGLTPYTLRGFRISRVGNLLAFNPVSADGFQLYVINLEPNGEFDDPRLIYRTKQETWKSIPSYAGEIVAMQSTERAGGMRRYSVLAFDTASSEQIGEVWDGPESSVEPVVFFGGGGGLRRRGPTPPTGFKRPLIWNLRTGERTNLPLAELEGEVVPLDWSLDGRRILLSQFNQAIQQLYLYDPAGDTLIRLNHPDGAFGVYDNLFGWAAYFGAEGEIFGHWQDAAHPFQLIALDGETGVKTRVALSAGEVPPGHAWQSITFTSSDGQEIQGWLGLPDGQGPFPAILDVHGGPHMVVTELFDPIGQAWLDHGFVYLTINFRGSTTFGREFQEKIWGNVGHWELEDMVAARNWLIERGIARPDAILLHGESYGGFLTLFGLGKRPDLWAAGLVVAPCTDWTEAYKDASDALKGAFRAWFGGAPGEKPEQYAASSPITYVENVRAPAFIVQGRHDTRTPAREVELYEARMKSLGKDVEVYWYDAGHGVADMELFIQFQEQMMCFAHRVLGYEPSNPSVLQE
jgi:dipeptidyl aminopeptidase/acylaminoacyl peptidase